MVATEYRNKFGSRSPIQNHSLYVSGENMQHLVKCCRKAIRKLCIEYVNLDIAEKHMNASEV